MTKFNRDSRSRKMSFFLLAAFFSLGFLSGCSDVKHEVVKNKQATAERVTRTYGPIEGTTKADHSLWNLSRKEN